MDRGSADGMVERALEGGAGPGQRQGQRWGRREPGRRLEHAGLVLGLLLLGACTMAPPPPGPFALGGPLLERPAAAIRAAPLAAGLEPAELPPPVEIDGPIPPAPLPVLRPRLAVVLPPPAKPPPPDAGPRIAWLPKLKPVPGDPPPSIRPPKTIWPPPPKPPLAYDWAPAAGPPATVGPAATPDPVVVGHGPAPRPDAGRAVAVADRDQRLESLDRSAREALLAGDAPTALRLYERLASEFPAAPAARLGQAIALQQLGRSAEAQALYQSLLAADPDDLGAKIALLGIVAERAPDEALSLLRRLARQHPDDHRLPAQIAVVLARKDDLGAAIVAERRAVALDPANAGYRANLAILYDRAGQASAAIEQYRRALELATLAGAPTTQLEAIAIRLHHLRQAQRPAAASPTR